MENKGTGIGGGCNKAKGGFAGVRSASSSSTGKSSLIQERSSGVGTLKRVWEGRTAQQQGGNLCDTNGSVGGAGVRLSGCVGRARSEVPSDGAVVESAARVAVRETEQGVGICAPCTAPVVECGNLHVASGALGQGGRTHSLTPERHTTTRVLSRASRRPGELEKTKEAFIRDTLCTKPESGSSTIASRMQAGAGVEEQSVRRVATPGKSSTTQYEDSTLDRMVREFASDLHEVEGSWSTSGISKVSRDMSNSSSVTVASGNSCKHPSSKPVLVGASNARGCGTTKPATENGAIASRAQAPVDGSTLCSTSSSVKHAPKGLFGNTTVHSKACDTRTGTGTLTVYAGVTCSPVGNQAVDAHGMPRSSSPAAPQKHNTTSHGERSANNIGGQQHTGQSVKQGDLQESQMARARGRRVAFKDPIVSEEHIYTLERQTTTTAKDSGCDVTGTRTSPRLSHAGCGDQARVQCWLGPSSQPDEALLKHSGYLPVGKVHQCQEAEQQDRRLATSEDVGVVLRNAMRNSTTAARKQQKNSKKTSYGFFDGVMHYSKIGKPSDDAMDTILGEMDGRQTLKKKRAQFIADIIRQCDRDSAPPTQTGSTSAPGTAVVIGSSQHAVNVHSPKKRNSKLARDCLLLTGRNVVSR